MATRRMDGARIDHGAQFYTARDIRLQALNNQWRKEERSIEWYDQVPGRTDIPTDMRYRGKTGMTGPAKSLTQGGSKLALNFFVEKIERTKRLEEFWSVKERGELWKPTTLVITMPSLQMLELFDRSSSRILEAEPMGRSGGNPSYPMLSNSRNIGSSFQAYSSGSGNASCQKYRLVVRQSGKRNFTKTCYYFAHIR